MRLLGEGGGGIVYLGEHQDTGERVAVKTAQMVAPDRIDLIRREIQALSRISHPDIVRIIDEGIDEGRPWYSMTYLGEATLVAWIEGLWRDQRLSDLSRTTAVMRDKLGVAERAAGVEAAGVARASGVDGMQPAAAGRIEEVFSVVAAMCRPLAFLHGEGIVHCDLKPSNVFLPSTTRAILADFGIATHFEGGTGRDRVESETHFRGTLAYMAPEQIQSLPVDARADLYSVGCILYELLTGQPPFAGRPNDILQAHLRTTPLPPSLRVVGIPQALDRLVLRLLAKEPSDRIGYAEDIVRVLEGLGARSDTASSGPPARPYLYRPAFVGRRLETDKLTRALDSVIDGGRGNILLVSGESGIGKSRTVAELARRARRRGATVVASECRSDVGNDNGGGVTSPFLPLRPFLQMLAGQCHLRGEDYAKQVLDQRGRLLIALEPAFWHFSVVSQSPEPPELPPDLAQRRIFGFLVDLLRSVSRELPLVVVIDDLQWADDLTVRFIEYLASTAISEMPLLLVATHRHEESRPELAPIAKTAVDVRLERLEADDVASLIRDMLGMQEPPEQLVAFLVKQSEGNPFFVGEYLRTAVTQRLIERDANGAWQARRDATASEGDGTWSLPLPGALRDLIELRLRDLPSEAKAILAAGAILGRSFSSDLARSVAGLTGPRALDAERELCARQVVTREECGHLRFDHERIREVTYEALPSDEQQRLHRSAAELLELTLLARLGALDTAGESELRAALGYHWAAARIPARAVEHFHAAARAARSVPAMHEAARCYRSALEQLRLAELLKVRDPERLRAEALSIEESLADVLEHDGQHEAARDTYLAAAEGLEPDRLVDRARLHRKIGHTWEVAHEHARALDALDEALTTLSDPGREQDADFRREWTEIQVRRAVVFYFRGDIAGMNGIIDTIQPVVESHGNEKQRAMLFHLQSNAKNRGHRFVASAEVVALARKAVEAIEDSNELLERINMRFDLGFALLWHGDVDSAASTLQDSLTMARSTGDLLLICRCLIYLGVAHRRRRDADSLAPIAEEALRVATAGAFADYIACARAHVGWLHLISGNREAAREDIGVAVGRWRELARTYPYPFQWLALLPHLALTLDGDDVAEMQSTAGALREETQLRLPAELDSALLAVVEANAKETSAVRAAVEGALAQAQVAGYV